VGSKIVISLLVVVLVAGLAYGGLGVYRLQFGQAAVHIPVQQEGATFDRAELYGRDYATIGDYLYFATFGGLMYRANLQTYLRELYLQMPVWGVVTDGERLLFVTANDTVPALVSYDPQTGDMLAITNRIDARAGIHYYNGMVFYVDNRGQIRSILPCGRPVATHAPTDVATFYVRVPYLIFTQHDCDLEKEYNMNTGEINSR